MPECLQKRYPEISPVGEVTITFQSVASDAFHFRDILNAVLHARFALLAPLIMPAAFDVVSSLSHRHGEFVPADHNDSLTYQPFEGTENFRMVLHSAEGKLPHLQFEQVEPFREIYRHCNRAAMYPLPMSMASSDLKVY